MRIKVFLNGLSRKIASLFSSFFLAFLALLIWRSFFLKTREDADRQLGTNMEPAALCGIFQCMKGRAPRLRGKMLTTLSQALWSWSREML